MKTRTFMIYKRFFMPLLMIVALSAFSALDLTAQGISIRNSTMEISGKSSPALMASFDFANEKDLIKRWKTYLKKEEKIKLGTKGGMLVQKETGPTSISEKQQDVYSRIVTRDGGLDLLFAVSFGYENFVSASAHPSEYQKMKNLFQAFANKYATDFYTDLLKKKDDEYNDAQRALNKSQSRFSGNKEKIESNDKDIQKMRDRINDLMRENRSLTESNLDLNKEISEQQKVAEDKKTELEKVQLKMKELGINP